MEINKISSQEIDLAKLAGSKLHNLEKSANKADSTPSIDLEIDSQDIESFGSLKDLVSGSAQPGRAEYVEKIKAAVLNGEYNVDSALIADSMIEDGLLEVLL